MASDDCATTARVMLSLKSADDNSSQTLSYGQREPSQENSQDSCQSMQISQNMTDAESMSTDHFESEATIFPVGCQVYARMSASEKAVPANLATATNAQNSDRYDV